MAKRDRSARSLLAWGTFGLLSLAAIGLTAAYAVNTVDWVSAPFRGWLSSQSGDGGVVIVASEVAEQAGLRVGDRIRTLNGQAFDTYPEMQRLLRTGLGEVNVYEIERDDLVLEIPMAEMGVLATLERTGGWLLAGLVFLGAAILVFLMKPREGPSWSFLLVGLVIGVGYPYLVLGPTFQPAWLEGVFIVATYVGTATVLQLAAFFPRRRAFFADRWPLLALPYLVALGLSVWELQTSYSYRVPTTLGSVRMALLAGSLLVFLGSALETWMRSQSSAHRIQAVAILTGGLLSGFVPTVDNLYTSLVGVRLVPFTILPVFLLGFPVSIGYAIVQHDLFEIDTIVRRTYGYLLSTAVVVATYGTVVSGLNVTMGPTDIMSSPFFSVVFILGMVFVMQPVQGRIQRVVDRAFYRQQYDYHATITSVSETMTTMLDPVEVQKTLVGTVVEEMFLENGILLAMEGGEFEVSVVAGIDWPADRTRRVQLDPALSRALVESRNGVFRHEIELAPKYAEDRQEMEASFDSLDGELMLPMVLKGEVRSVLSLGRKKSGKMFTREDIALLRTLINQGAIALENARLFDEVAANLKQIQMLETVKGNLAKFVPQTVQNMLEDGADSASLFEKRETDLTVMFADMTGYTRMSSQLPMDEVNEIIERYFGAFLDEILRAGGDVNETAGDGLMILFQDDDPDRHARAAVSAAVGIQRLTREINAERLAAKPGTEPVGMHIGLNSGTASVGATKISGGAGMRWTYTASGPITNIAARVGALGEEIAITHATRERLGEGFGVEEVGPQSLKNVPEPVLVYRVTEAPRVEALAPSAPETPEAPLIAESMTSEEYAERSGRFVILGTVSEQEGGRRLEGLLVRAFDKDLLFDDYLGEGRSDVDGGFEIRFTDEFFSDLAEKHPDIYLKVFDPAGDRLLISTEQSVRWNAGAVERFEVEIPKNLLNDQEGVVE